jgi:hypothetical protein
VFRDHKDSKVPLDLVHKEHKELMDLKVFKDLKDQ